jgi:hypothetical protein
MTTQLGSATRRAKRRLCQVPRVRNLGTARSLNRAYRQHKATEGVNAPGYWHQLSVRRQWVERATAWDVFLLRTVATRIVVRPLAVTECLAEQALTGVNANPPTTFEQGLRAWEMVCEFVEPEAIGVAAAASTFTPEPEPE